MPWLPASLHRLALRTAYPLALQWWRLTRPSVRGVYVVFRRDAGTPDEAWLFVRNSYRAGMSVPGGGIGRRESPLAAARRETREEVGLDVDAMRLRATTELETWYLHRLDHGHFFEVDVQPGEALEPRPDEREIVWAGFERLVDLDPNELVEPVRIYLERARGAA